MQPLTLKSYNIGSQDGLKAFLSWLYKISGDVNHNIILCDINIYWRLIRLRYNVKSSMNVITSHNTFILGFWHPYKELCLKIWKTYYWLFGPVYHTLWNDKKIFSKPRLIHLEQIYTWFMLNWNDGLIELVESYIVETADKPAINVFFTNIRLLFGYYLSMVCYFIL